MDSRDPPDPLPISALEHYSYCPRQCALIHVEQTFDENLYTLRGRLLHERTDSGEEETAEGVRVTRALPLWSDRLGLVGKADVVEFHRGAPYPVEYKVGRRRDSPHAALQLCAQAICLEEMTGQAVPRGALYHHASRKRVEVVFDAALRQAVAETTQAVRQLLRSARLPPPANDGRCRACSLRESCLPEVTGEPKRLLALHHSLFVTEHTEVNDEPPTAEHPVRDQ